MQTKQFLKKYKHQWYLKNKIKHKNQAHIWYLNHRKNNIKRATKWIKANRQKHRFYLKNYKTKYPWLASYYGAKNRCCNLNNYSYERYGGKGIKMIMTKDDFKYLWVRDKAYLLKQPSIDRINNKGHYKLSNCRFIELSENSKRRAYHVFCGNRKLLP